MICIWNEYKWNGNWAILPYIFFEITNQPKQPKNKLYVIFKFVTYFMIVCGFATAYISILSVLNSLSRSLSLSFLHSQSISFFVGVLFTVCNCIQCAWETVVGLLTKEMHSHRICHQRYTVKSSNNKCVAEIFID